MCELCDENDEMRGCQDCGRLICFDCEGADDIMRRAYVTASGDLFCDICGLQYDKEEECLAEDEATFYPDPFEQDLMEGDYE